MINFKVSLNLADVMAVKSVITKEVFPLLHQAVRAVAVNLAENWRQEVYAQRGLWMGEKDAYAQSISYRMESDFSAVVEAKYEQAIHIENGRPGRDLKKMLDTSQKVRRTEEGKRFLVIPLRHNVPGSEAHARAMPPSVHAMAKELAASRVLAQGFRPSGEVTHLSPKSGMSPSHQHTPFSSDPKTKGETMVARSHYQWGGALTAAMLKAAGMDKTNVRRLAGMRRFDTGTAGAPHSDFMTFRIMMEGQTGWVTQAQPPRGIAKKVEAEMQPLAQKAFEQAMTLTVKKG